jgi:hypothetical protein
MEHTDICRVLDPQPRRIPERHGLRPEGGEVLPEVIEEKRTHVLGPASSRAGGLLPSGNRGLGDVILGRDLVDALTGKERSHGRSSHLAIVLAAAPFYVPSVPRHGIRQVVTHIPVPTVRLSTR